MPGPGARGPGASTVRDCKGSGAGVCASTPECARVRKAIVGTVNLDYRSLYLHFENACFMYDMPAVMDIKADFEKMFAERSHEVTPDDLLNRSRVRRAMAAMLKILEPRL